MNDQTFEFAYTDADFEALRDLITPRVGIMLPDSKRTLVYTRLSRRLRHHNLTNFKEYIAQVQAELKRGEQEELTHIINAITTNVTAFFREDHHFIDLAEQLPNLLAKFGKLRLWSAACSSGEEPWSVAMVVAEFLKKNPTADVKILATDLDQNMIDRAKAGVYSLAEDAWKADRRLKTWLEPLPEEERPHPLGHKQYKVKEELRKLVTFQPINLIEPWRLPWNEIHVVFCRNVVIYFSKDTQRVLFAQMAKHMPVASRLYIGHSESLINVSTVFKHLGRTAHERIADDE